MSEPRATDLDPRDVVRGKSNFDREALAPRPGATNPTVDPSGKPQPTPEEVAQQTHIQQQARPDSRPDRDDKLTNLGRGHHTHG